MKKTVFFAATSILCWSTVATVSKILLGSFNNFQVLSLSSLFAFAFLLIFNIATGNIKSFKTYRLKDYCISVLIAIPSTIFYYVFYYAGADMMPASQAFIINYLWPIMSIVFACIILKEKVTARKIIAVVISFLGVLIVTGSAFSQFNASILIGALFCILGAMSYGLFTSLNQKYNYDKWLSMMLGYLTAFIFTFILNAASGNLFTPSVGQCIGFAWNGIFTMAIGNVTWVLALRSAHNTAKVSNFAYITPFLSLVWTALFLKEEITLYSVLGLVVIVLGIFVQIKEKAPATQTKAEEMK